jgi:hypothetical protein
LSHSENNIQL